MSIRRNNNRPNHDVCKAIRPPLPPFRQAVYKTSKIKKPMNFVSARRNQRALHEGGRPSEAKESETDLDVPCMNCMRMVRSSLVAEHSQRCSQVQSEVKLIDQCSLVQQADYKLRKLLDSVQRLFKDSPSLLRSGNNHYYAQMITEYCEDILKITDFTKLDILKCREVIHNLMMLLKTFKGSTSVLIYMERLLTTSKDKYAQLLSYYREIAKADAANLRTKEELKNMVEEKHEELKNSLHKVSEVRATILSERRSKYDSVRVVEMGRGTEIISDVGRVKYIYNIYYSTCTETEKKSITSAISIPENNMKDVEEALAVEESKKVQKANLKRYFFTLIANAKKVLGPKNIGYYVDSTLLFNEVIRRQQSVDDWPAFIMTELNNNPNTWVVPKKYAKIQALLRQKSGKNSTMNSSQG
eukprot:TRINITY_DN9808_c0_g1_i6.p1 TRINITY_DN9808_c0_g1~~TRINITY_DN9808_c0_g1_i6.p1  ORF type:complete len:414 (-),score=117.21 TRINITY_DN9808_c0_g1_i6:270-1511(-)